MNSKESKEELVNLIGWYLGELKDIFIKSGEDIVFPKDYVSVTRFTTESFDGISIEELKNECDRLSKIYHDAKDFVRLQKRLIENSSKVLY